MHPIVILYAVVATILAGMGVIAVLVLGLGTFWSLVGAIAGGALLALLISWLIARETD
jgi:hypothetical protein